MGLDSVEILMEVENAFGIKIPGEEAEKIITVGDFHNSVWKHMDGRQIDKCHSQAVFYKLRSDLASQNQLFRSEITLDTSPDMLLPFSNRKQAYKMFEKNSGFSLPELELPKPWSQLLSWIALGIILGSLITEFILIIFFNYSVWNWLWTAAAILLVWVISELADPWRTKIAVSNMREFTIQVLTLNYKRLSYEGGTNRQEMEVVINQIIADKAGLEIKEVTPEKRIGDDLGVD
jgi:acyl carrier protein